MQSYSQISGHHSQKSERYEMTKKGSEDPLISRELKSNSNTFYKHGDQAPVQTSESNYEQTNQRGKGVLSLSKAFENKSVQNPISILEGSSTVGKPIQLHQQRYDHQQRHDHQQQHQQQHHQLQHDHHRQHQRQHDHHQHQQHDYQHHHQQQQHQLHQNYDQQHIASSLFSKMDYGDKRNDQRQITQIRTDNICQKPLEKSSLSFNQTMDKPEVNNQYGCYQSHGEYADQRRSGFVHDHQNSKPLQFHVPGSHAYEMTAFVQAPSERREQCQVIDLDDNNYSIRFIPHETGTHSVSVKHKGIDIPGSPFEFFVGPVAGGGARSIQVYGSGLSGGYVKDKCQFEIFTKEAGAGSLSVAVEGPVKSEIDFSDKKDGTCIVSYVCPESGEYKISVKFNDQHVPGSPFNAHMQSRYGDMPQMQLNQDSDSHMMNEQMSFTVDMSGKKGRLEAYIISPDGTEEACTLHEGANNSYSIRFTPSQSGLHWVHVRYNGKEIPDSPFRVPVNETICDPSKVFASGAGLYHGQVNQTCQFFIDTSAAGTGALSVTVDGPSKVDIDCVEIGKGYQSSFTPTMPGIYIVLIKFAEVQIAGSPFHCRVYDDDSQGAVRSMHGEYIRTEMPLRPINMEISDKGIANPEKVYAYGTGLSHTFVNEDAHFTVDTHEAGRSVLTISIQGPRKPNRDIEVRKCGDNLYDVCYNLPQSGTYNLTVKWANHHIAGSPYSISVA